MVEQMEAYKPADDSAPAATLSKARQRLCEIKPVRCRHAGCTHLGPTSEIEKHEAMCLFALTLMPHAAIVKTAGDCLNGFELVATGPENAQYAGTYKPGKPDIPCTRP